MYKRAIIYSLIAIMLTSATIPAFAVRVNRYGQIHGSVAEVVAAQELIRAERKAIRKGVDAVVGEDDDVADTKYVCIGSHGRCKMLERRLERKEKAAQPAFDPNQMKEPVYPQPVEPKYRY